MIQVSQVLMMELKEIRLTELFGCCASRTELTERHRTFSYMPLRVRLDRGTEPSLTATGIFTEVFCVCSCSCASRICDKGRSKSEAIVISDK